VDFFALAMRGTLAEVWMGRQRGENGMG